MPELNFTIAGIGSQELVKDYALLRGYKTEIVDQNGNMIPNPQTNVEYIANDLLMTMKAGVKQYRKMIQTDEFTDGLDAELEAELAPIRLEM